MGKKFFVIIGVVIAVSVLVVLMAWFWPSSTLPPAKVAEFEIGNDLFEVEIADTDSLREHGLSDRQSLGSDRGMLFVFPDAGTQVFWMKGMQFPLDFVWIRNLIVVGVSERVPADGGKTLLPSPEPVDAVLEINAGEIARREIRVGDRALIRSRR